MLGVNIGMGNISFSFLMLFFFHQKLMSSLLASNVWISFHLVKVAFSISNNCPLHLVLLYLVFYFTQGLLALNYTEVLYIGCRIVFYNPPLPPSGWHTQLLPLIVHHKTWSIQISTQFTYLFFTCAIFKYNTFFFL